MNHIAIYKKISWQSDLPFYRQFASVTSKRKKSKKLWIPKMKLSRINKVRFIRKVLADFEKVAGFLNPLVRLSQKVLTLHKMVSLSCYLIVWRWL